MNLQRMWSSFILPLLLAGFGVDAQNFVQSCAPPTRSGAKFFPDRFRCWDGTHCLISDMGVCDDFFSSGSNRCPDDSQMNEKLCLRVTRANADKRFTCCNGVTIELMDVCDGNCNCKGSCDDEDVCKGQLKCLTIVHVEVVKNFTLESGKIVAIVLAIFFVLVLVVICLVCLFSQKSMDVLTNCRNRSPGGTVMSTSTSNDPVNWSNNAGANYPMQQPAAGLAPGYLPTSSVSPGGYSGLAYPPTSAPGYPPTSAPGYLPTLAPGYPLAAVPGYPPATAPGGYPGPGYQPYPSASTAPPVGPYPSDNAPPVLEKGYPPPGAPPMGGGYPSEATAPPPYSSL